MRDQVEWLIWSPWLALALVIALVALRLRATYVAGRKKRMREELRQQERRWR